MASSNRIASIDWMRGFVMILMLIDHVSMVYNKGHLSDDSATIYTSGTVLPALEFFTRWISHLCAPVFVFLAGTALAISIERKVSRGVDAAQIDKDILIRGAFIALLDPTLISLFAGKFTFQVLYAIGAAMMCMAFFRRLSSTLLIIIALAWFSFSELLNAYYYPPEIYDFQSVINALLFSTYRSPELTISYPLLPWLAIMILGWVFGRYLLNYKDGKTSLEPIKLLMGLGIGALAGFLIVRYLNGYGNLFLYRDSDSWQQWLHVSKYPPSATFALLELGIMSVLMAIMMMIEKRIGVRQNGILLVFGQTAMFYYLVHRLVLVGVGNGFDLNDIGGLQLTYVISAVFIVILYPMCIWYRGFKSKHPNSIFLKYI